MAKRWDVSDPDSRTGTRPFQSVKVLFQDPKLGQHDHMDDLESIYYVLLYVCYGHDEDGNGLPSLPVDIGLWFSIMESLGSLARIKRDFLQSGPLNMIMTRFPEEQERILEPLLGRLPKFFQKRLEAIGAARRGQNPVSFPPYSPAAASDDYSEFLVIIENAIRTLEQLPVVPAVLLPPSLMGSTGSKRPRGSEEEPAIPRKKQHSCAPDPCSTEPGISRAR
ncbi:hypothetical protein DFH06DRAFT_1175475 [Mycena polygramma]|nr:hypothetical protein DFH06DRAFT_1175475 [Mycena polygramma]